jgi:hypothetical protein
MRLLVLDISTSTGFAVFDKIDGKDPVLVSFGTLKNEKAAYEYAPHPYGYVLAAQNMAAKVLAVFNEWKPDKTVIEEVNGARQRFVQKLLDYLHFAILTTVPFGKEVYYIDTSEWRKVMDARLTKEDKAQNAKLSKAKRDAKKKGKKLDKKELGINGKITTKHVAVRRAMEETGLDLLAKDDDIADAILQGLAFLKGAKICNGRINGKAEA